MVTTSSGGLLSWTCRPSHSILFFCFVEVVLVAVFSSLVCGLWLLVLMLWALSPLAGALAYRRQFSTGLEAAAKAAKLVDAAAPKTAQFALGSTGPKVCSVWTYFFRGLDLQQVSFDNRQSMKVDISHAIAVAVHYCHLLKTQQHHCDEEDDRAFSGGCGQHGRCD